MVHLVLFASVLIALMGRGKSKYFFAAACWVLFLFAALRYMYGSDYPAYYAHYLEIRAGNPDVYDEWLFTLLNRLSPSFYVVIAVTSAVFVYGVYRLIIGTLSTRDAWLGLLIFVISPYLFLMNLSAIRQCMAMVLFMAAIPFAARKKLIPYALLILLATMMHKTAVILLPIYFVASSVPFKRRHVCAVALALGLLLSVVDLTAIVKWFSEIVNDNNYYYYVRDGATNSLRATLLTGISFVYVLGNLPRLKGRELVYAKLYLIGTALGVLAFRMSMLTRIQMYFDIFAVVAIPAIIRTDLDRGVIRVDRDNLPGTLWNIVNRFLLPALVFVVYVLRYYSFFTNDSWSAFFHYQTIFSAIGGG